MTTALYRYRNLGECARCREIYRGPTKSAALLLLTFNNLMIILIGILFI
jgi:hypothetical protein